MAKRCKYCFSKLSGGSSVCGVCKIDSAKSKKDLTKEEKKIAYWCRTLYIMGFLAIVGGAFGAFLLFPYVVLIIRGETEHLGRPGLFWYFYTISTFILSIVFIFFGIALRRYKKWCYVGGIILYSFFIMLYFPGINVIAILAGAFFLYCIATRTSRKILYGEIGK